MCLYVDKHIPRLSIYSENLMPLHLNYVHPYL